MPDLKFIQIFGKLCLVGFLRNIRFYILVVSIGLAAGIYFYITSTIESEQTQISKLTQIYALTAVTYLYLALMASPVTRFFTFLPFRSQYIFSRRALGVSAWLFAELHVYYAFFGELGGFEGLQYLNSSYLTAVSLGAISISILTLMTATSFDFVIDKLSFPKWKMLHRFVYLVAALTVIHALMLGSHFTNLNGSIPQIFSIALGVLIVLEAVRLDRYLTRKFPRIPKAGIAFFTASLFIGFAGIALIAPADYTSSLSLHEQHIQIAKEAADTSLPDYLKNVPGMQGDKTKRFTIDWDFAEPVIAGQDTLLKFRVYDAGSGAPVELFNKNYDKLMHLVIVDSSLDYYLHIHPEFKDGWFQVVTKFPSDGRYNLYMDFLPVGAIEQQFAMSLKTSGYSQDKKFSGGEDQNFTKKFGKYNINLKFDKPLKASLLSIGAQELKYTIYSDKNEPVTTLKPYLGSFGHLVMINTRTYEYIHVHPVQTKTVMPGENGGPEVDFLPLGIYGPIKPGLYRLFAQFNPDDNLMTSIFTVEVE